MPKNLKFVGLMQYDGGLLLECYYSYVYVYDINK